MPSSSIEAPAANDYQDSRGRQQPTGNIGKGRRMFSDYRTEPNNEHLYCNIQSINQPYWLSHLSGVPHLHVTGAKNPSWPESNQLAIYKHGGGPELQPTEKNQRGDFGGTTVPCSIFFLKFPRVLMYAFHILRKVRKLKCVSFFRSSIYV